jgi:hypothetical protein
MSAASEFEYNLPDLCEYLTDSDVNLRQLASDANLDDEKKIDLIFEAYDNLDKLTKIVNKIKTQMRHQFKFSQKQAKEYFEDDAESKELDQYSKG